MRQMMMVIAAALALAGCQTASDTGASSPVPTLTDADKERVPGYVRPKDDVAMARAKAAVAAMLKDPESARFTEVARSTNPNAKGQPTDVVCGKVNSKNSYGGYTGAKPFVYIVAGASSHIAEGDSIGVWVVRGMCTGQFSS